MLRKERRIRENEQLRFREIGSGFIIASSIEGMPRGRKLAKTFTDQFDRLYVQVNGELEPVTDSHCYLAA